MIAVALVACAPGALANAWGYDTDVVLFSRFQTNAGPSVGLNPGMAGDLAAQDTRFVVPGADAVSVRTFVTDVVGEPVTGVLLDGTIVVDDARHDLDFHEMRTPEGDVVYDAQRIAYAGGHALVDVWFDFDADGAWDDRVEVAYRPVG